MSTPATQRRLDEEIGKSVGDLRERYWDDQREASRGKTVIIVEGDDDADVLGAIFKARKKTWDVKTRLISAGSRAQVLAQLEKADRDRANAAFPDAYGLVDRDTWTDEEIAQQQQQYPRLYVTEGWCLENVFLSPRWLRQYNAAVAARLAQERERWVRAGALWWCLQRAREAQQRWQEALGWSYGGPHADLDVSSAAGLAASLAAKIPEDVRQSATFDAERVAAAFEVRCRDVLAADEETQWRIGVHGKRAFNMLLVPALTVDLVQRPQRVTLAPHIGRPAPPPLDALIAILFP